MEVKNSIISYLKLNRGILGLLTIGFLLFLYALGSWGLVGAAPIALAPLVIIIVLLLFKDAWKLFWLLFALNYLIMGLGRYIAIPVPISVLMEGIYLAVIAGCIMNRKEYENTYARVNNFMTYTYLVWVIYCVLQLLNQTCELPFAKTFICWYADVRLLAFQILYLIIIYSILFKNKSDISRYTKVWAFFSILAVTKVFMQQYIGFDYAEQNWLDTLGAKTHIVNGITRYFSFFTDSANFGCNMAASTVVFFALAMSSNLKKDKIFYGITAFLTAYGMMASGTRAAIFTMAGGLVLYTILSKNFKIFFSTIFVLVFFIGILMVTTIGQGNSMIRRMRSAFNKDDASLNVRLENQDAMSKYLREAPWGIGLGIQGEDVPQSNKNHFLALVAPDSTLVYIWIRTGIIGLSLFITIMLLIIIRAGFIVFTQIKEPELRGQLTAFVCGASSMLVAGYGNQIMIQFPNAMLFFGSLALVYCGTSLDKNTLAEQAAKTKKRLMEHEQTAPV